MNRSGYLNHYKKKHFNIKKTRPWGRPPRNDHASLTVARSKKRGRPMKIQRGKPKIEPNEP